jgi:hypothetical protein
MWRTVAGMTGLQGRFGMAAMLFGSVGGVCPRADFCVAHRMQAGRPLFLCVFWLQPILSRIRRHIEARHVYMRPCNGLRMMRRPKE